MWAALAVLVSLTQGPGFVRSLTPAAGESVDFFQEWASARNFLDGAPIYTDLEVSAARYLGRRSRPVKGSWSARTLTRRRRCCWRFRSVCWTTPRHTDLEPPVARRVCRKPRASGTGPGAPPPSWGILPAITLLLICNPFRQQVNQGQFNLLLLLLMTGVWTAERSGRSALAGMLLGAATAFELFPGFSSWISAASPLDGVASGLAAIAMLSLVSWQSSARTYEVTCGRSFPPCHV